MAEGGVAAVPCNSEKFILTKSLEHHSGEKGQGASSIWILFWSIGDLAPQPISPKEVFLCRKQSCLPIWN